MDEVMTKAGPVTLDRLRCAFNPSGTTSGRLSSGKTIFGTGTNMQNLPRDPKVFKQFLMADDGYIIYELDLSQAENRVVAYIAPDPNMIEAFEKEVDIHRKTAGAIFKKPIDQISDEPGSSSIGSGTESERDWGKRANHALNYDMGYKTFAFRYEFAEHDAKMIVESYHMLYPGVRRYHRWIQTQLGKDRTLTDCHGYKRLFLDRWGDELFKEGYSWIPQSTIGRGINKRGVIIAYNQLRPVELLNQVHDSIVFQISKGYSVLEHAKCIWVLKQSLEAPLTYKGMKFSIPVDLKAGIAWGLAQKVSLKGVAGPEGIAQRLREVFDGLQIAF